MQIARIIFVVSTLAIGVIGCVSNIVQIISGIPKGSLRATKWKIIISIILILFAIPALLVNSFSQPISLNPLTGSNPSPVISPNYTNTVTLPSDSTHTPGITPTVPTDTPTPTPTSPTDWGYLTGNTINVNKPLTCGAGCPEPLHLKIATIQIDTTNDLMIWNANFFAPANGSTNGITEVSFSDFALESNTTPFYQATQAINSPGSLQAKFPFTPVPNEIYTLTVIANYHTLTDGIISINSTSLQYEQVTMSFQL